MSPDPEFTIITPQPLLIVISGPSGVGKDTIMQRMQERGMPFHFVVTATTRPKRENEDARGGLLLCLQRRICPHDRAE